jgi:hypothetical protein
MGADQDLDVIYEGLMAATERVKAAFHEIDLQLLAIAPLAEEVVQAGVQLERDWDGHVSPGQHLRVHCKIPGGMAQDVIDVGELMHLVPESVEALRRGEIGFTQLALIARLAHRTVSSAPAGDLFNEPAVLAHARKETVREFRKTAAHLHHIIDQDGFRDGQVIDEESSTLILRKHDAGAVSINARLYGEAAAAVVTALEAHGRRLDATDGRDKGQRLAGALHEICLHALDDGTAPRLGGVRPHLTLTGSIETLLGIPGAPAVTLENGSPLSAATMQRHACDASVSVITLDRNGEVLDAGRARRTASPQQRRALAVRDKGRCVWPGCERPASWTTAHHVTAWSALGPSDVENMMLLCRRHHWLVHEGEWVIVATPDGVATLPPWRSEFWEPRAPAVTDSA